MIEIYLEILYLNITILEEKYFYNGNGNVINENFKKASRKSMQRFQLSCKLCYVI